jgi:2-polyprenyl-3-methyl-5-hydroxy-6-metoxy-1,4-benzoquinol methylase
MSATRVAHILGSVPPRPDRAGAAAARYHPDEEHAMTLQADPTYVFERSGDEYDRLTRQAALFEPVTERLLRDAGISPGMRVLDVGSGVGDVALLLARLVGPHGCVVGVDLDGSALQTARARAGTSGLRNLTFIQGDVRSAETGAHFDAAVGRLVLAYLADPADALRAIVERLRPGGVVAFQELDLDPDVPSRSLPPGTLWDRTGRLVIETFAGAGTHLRMGRQLRGSYLTAGLPDPVMREEAIVGGGPDFAGYSWLAGVARSLAPLTARLGIVADREFDPERLAERLRDDAVAHGAVVWGPALVGAYARRP